MEHRASWHEDRRMKPADSAAAAITDRLPPHVYFLVSAVFHYLGPAFAVLLFAHLAPLGVAWLRIATAGAVFALWRRPWRFHRRLTSRERGVVVGLGIVLALMNASFYLAIARLPLATVGAIEFLGPIGLAAVGFRSRRNLLALALAIAGVYLLTQLRFQGEALGYVFAFLNCALFVLYIVLGHRIAAEGGAEGIDRLGAAMLVAAIAAAPLGFADALPAFRDPDASRRGNRRGALLLGDPLCLRPARHGAPPAGDLRADAGAAACDRLHHRPARPAPGAHGPGSRRLGLGDRRCRPASAGA